jgi:outer membrane lipoprotein-sorting protein
VSKKFTLISVLCLLGFGLYSYAQTVDEIISKNMEARGGLEKISALKSMKLTGRMELQQGVDAPILVYQKRPNFVRVEFTLQGMVGVQAYDGHKAWMVMPFIGAKVPQLMPEEDASDIIEQSDFDGPLVNYKAKGVTVELAGKEDVQGAPAYKIKVTLKTGAVRYFFIDAEKYLDRKIVRTIKSQGAELLVDTFLGNYKEINGLMVPFSVDSKAGERVVNHITWENVEFDVPMDDSMFKMPTEAPQTQQTEPAN